MITVRLPAMLRRPEMPLEFDIDTPVESIEELIGTLEARYPGLAHDLDDSIYNFAVNDTLVLRGVMQHPLRSGDVVEVIPTIAGG